MGEQKESMFKGVGVNCSDIHKLAFLCGRAVFQRVSAATHFFPCLIRKGQLVPCEESSAGAQKGVGLILHQSGYLHLC